MESLISIYDHKDKELKSYEFPTEEANKVMGEIEKRFNKIEKEGDFITLVFGSSENGFIGIGLEEKVLGEENPVIYCFSPNDLDGILEILEK